MFIVIKGKVNDYIPKTMGEINDENDKIELEIQRKKEEELAKRADSYVFSLEPGQEPASTAYF